MRLKIFESCLLYPLCLSSQLLSNSGSMDVKKDEGQSRRNYFVELEKRQGLI